MEVVSKCFFYIIVPVMTFNMLSYGVFAENAAAELYYVKDADVRFAVNRTTVEAPSILICSRLCQREEACKSFYFMPVNSLCILNHDLLTNMTYTLRSDANMTIQYGVLRKIISTANVSASGSSSKCQLPVQIPGIFKDCKELYDAGQRMNGVYTINPGVFESIAAECDMSSGGFTVLQKRMDGSVDFYRNWTEYENGFGCPPGEHWLGLRYIHLLSQNANSLCIEMEANVSSSPPRDIACYGKFQIADARNFYQLTVGNFLDINSSVTDSFSYHNGLQFSTYNKDNDIRPNFNCAETFHGGWWYVGGLWYYNCTQAILNGKYRCDTESAARHECNYWVETWKFNYTLQFSKMRMRRN